jgi:hypothetical protein
LSVLQYTRIWDAGQKDDRKNIKLKVNFKYPEPPAGSAPSSSFGGQTISENVENVRSTLTRVSAPLTMDDVIRDPSMVLTELDSLKKKYDAVVDYTVHLTAERDTIVAQLEQTQRELSREISNKRGDTKIGTKSSKGGEKKQATPVSIA